MRKVLGALFVALSLLSSVAAANMMNSFYFIPVVTKAPGLNGTYWQSDVTVTNLGPTSVQVGTRVFYSDVANTFDGSLPVNFWVAPGQTVILEDFFAIYAFWAKTPAEGKGFLVLADITPVNCNVPSPPTSPSGLLAVTSRTYNTGDPKGTYSTSADMNLTALNFTTYPSVITGVRQTGTTAPGFRTNVSIANISTTRIRVVVKIFNAAGALAAPESFQTVEALSFKQWSLANLGVQNLGAGPGRVEVRLADGQVADPCASVTDTFCTNPCDPQKCPTKYAMRSQPTFFAYASTTDNGTGDGTILSSFLDWQGYYKWVSDYQNQHCPDIKIYQNNKLTDWLKSRGFIEPDPPPTFRKVGRK